MSPIVNLQRQLREIGRIRIGNQVATSGGKRRPAKLETFRITSSSEEMVGAAAQAYGGIPTSWDNGGSPEYEVITATTVLPIVMPPGEAVSQWMELWSGGGCQRRCDGETEMLSMQPCRCPADVETRVALAAKGEACKATTRLRVILPELPDLGVFRLESHGYYAAVELAGAAEVLAMATARGYLIPARLRLEQRTKKVPGKPTLQYAVPVIEFTETRMTDLGIVSQPVDAPRLAAGRPAIPQLPSTTLPERSTFRAPAPADPDHVDLATSMRLAAIASGRDEQAPQDDVLKLRSTLFAGWDRELVRDGLVAIWNDQAVTAPSVAQIEALALVGGSMSPVAFLAAWRALISTLEEVPA